MDASNNPLSIIIIGVGSADFTAMDELDGDTVRVTTDDGMMAARDIVQFVPMRNFINPGQGSSGPTNTSAYTHSHHVRLHLAQEVLAEIAEQFLSFMKVNRIVPRPGSRHAEDTFQKPHVNNLPPDPEFYHFQN